MRKIAIPLIHFLKENSKGKKVYFLTSILSAEYPTVDYAGAIHCSRFPYLMWMPSVLKTLAENRDNHDAKQIYAMNVFFSRLLAEDIAIKKPEFIFVDTSHEKRTLVFTVKDFNYIDFFMHLPQFKSVWEHYHFKKTIELSSGYRFSVYQLNHA